MASEVDSRQMEVHGKLGEEPIIEGGTPSHLMDALKPCFRKR